MYSYIAYGLGVSSPFAIPEFPPATGSVQVTIRVLDRGSEPDFDDDPHFEVAPTETVLGFKHVGTFRVRQGKEIDIAPAPNADWALIRLFLVGKVMGTLLYQRGLFVLHGSSVEVEGRAVVFIGASYVGKSSIAATLYEAGHRVLADDVAAVDLSTDTPLVTPAFPLLKVDPVVAGALGRETESLIVLHPGELRRGLNVADRFLNAPSPLGLIYLVESNAGESAAAAPGLLIELIRQSFPTRLRHPGGPTHLTQCARLAKKVPARRLSIQDARVTPAELSQRVRADLANV